MIPCAAWSAGAFLVGEEEMPVTLALALLGAGGIAFYVCFLVALSRERKVHRWRGGYWVRLRLESDKDPILERRKQEGQDSRAA